jgi:hypothetical protein
MALLNKNYSASFILPALYGAACLIAVAYVLWKIVFTPGESELAAVIIVALGLPWSMIFAFAMLALGSSSAWGLALACIFSCIFNAWLLHKIGSKFSRRLINR